MSSLDKVNISINQFGKKQLYSVDHGRGVIHLLQALCNVQSMHLAIQKTDKLFPTRLESMLVFQNFVELEYESVGRGTWLMEFLHCVPNQKKLMLASYVGGFRTLPNEVPLCLLFHLEEIKISSFCGDIQMFGMVGYFLNHASVLEKLIVIIFVQSEKQRVNILEELLSLPKNSKECQVLTL
ncbi:hypothetical protein like AT1G66320 [Hibiscus trionum]|uniref:FBD domain-containing protein n=1 Tax=Hibiscus trionum TaxID=183268 RepID=A0A9W7HPY8_HIBTR|nr:hypothetical protein like AT1G66320 [Hibiscus trionum]